MQLRPWLLAAAALSIASCGGGGDTPDAQQRANPPAAQIAKARLIERGDAICRRDQARLAARLAAARPPAGATGIALTAPYLALNEQAIREGAQKIAALGRPSADAGLLDDYLDERTTAANALRTALAAAKQGDTPGFEAAVKTYGANAAQAAAARFGFKACGLGASRVEGRRATSTSGSASTAGARGPSGTTTAKSPAGQLRVEILDARLFTDGRPSGVQPQPARMTVRVRVSNPGTRRVTLDAPVLKVGSLRIATDAERADARLPALPPGTEQTVSLRFALAGEATPKVVRDRRARVLIAGRSVAIRVRVRAPAG